MVHKGRLVLGRFDVGGFVVGMVKSGPHESAFLGCFFIVRMARWRPGDNLAARLPSPCPHADYQRSEEANRRKEHTKEARERGTRHTRVQTEKKMG